MSVAPEPVNPEHDPMTIDPSNLGSVDPLSVEGLFLVALGKQGDERAAFLAEQCGDDERRQRVEALLAAYESAGSFLQKPAIAIEPTPVGQYLAPCEVPGAMGRLGPYEILEEIGRGGMGVVFRAHDPKLQRIVAVKALAPELARLPSARQRFLREARAAAAISHPHVVTIFAVDGTEEASLGTERATLPYLVMECIVGQTLHDKIKRQGALKTEEIVRISRQIAEGLGAAHKRGLIHRDIKPANILLENGVERVKITDFGLARSISDGGITHTGEILGTPQCMSPEQARGELVDQRSDLFSLGCVMYTMCTGLSPFRADNMLAVMKKVCEATPHPIAQLNRDIPTWLCGLVHQLLEKQAELRVQTAGEVVEVLEARAIATGVQAATSPTTPHSVASSQSAQGDAPKWLLTPVIPGLEQWLFKDSLLPVTLIAMLIGFLLGDNRQSRIQMLPLAGILGFGLLALAKVLLKAPWNWINGKSMVSVPLGMYLGGVSRAWLIHRNRSGASWTEELARNNAGWFVFPLAIGVFWLLNRYFRDLFMQNPKSDSATRSIPSQPMHWSTWVVIVLTVLTVGILAFGDSRFSMTPNIIELLLWVYAVALNVWIIVHLVAWGVKLAKSRDSSPPVAFAADATAAQTTPRSRSPWSVLGWMIVGVLGLVFCGGALVFIAIAIPAWQARQALPATQDNPGTPYGFIQITCPPSETVKSATIDGLPVMLRMVGEKQWTMHVAPGPHQLQVEFESSNPQQLRLYKANVSMFADKMVEIDVVPTVQVRVPSTETTPVTLPDPASPSIPLADAVEVLTDTSKMPIYPDGIRGFGSNQLITQVWIDEPGLIIRLKQLDFEGEEKSGVEFVSNPDWGVGYFTDQENGGPWMEIPTGRYRVLVQDIDYGWSLDRRGMIVIGRGKQTIHVKRSFAGQQLAPAEYPVPFRWAGKSYQLTTADQVSTINRYLAQLAGETAKLIPGSQANEMLITHPLGEQIAMVNPPGDWTLKYSRQLIKLELPDDPVQESITFDHPQGVISWKRSVPEGFHIPEGDLKYRVRYEPGFGWPGDDSQALDLGEVVDQPLVIGRLTKAMMREAVSRENDHSDAQGSSMRWFREQSTMLSIPAVSAAKRLVLAWLDGQPDVPESELLALGKADSFESLWKSGVPADELMPSILVPGSTPGTWRLKEPPEGAVAKE